MKTILILYYEVDKINNKLNYMIRITWVINLKKSSVKKSQKIMQYIEDSLLYLIY